MAWKDDRGFGFITPAGGGERLFVHISEFIDPDRRPIGNEVVTYNAGPGEKGRWQALDVEIVGKRRWSFRFIPVTLVAFSFLAVVTGLAAMGRLPLLVPVVYLLASAAAYVMYAADKIEAGAKGRRVPEKRLLFLGLIGGWPGALLARERLRHKTKKRSFIAAFWFTAVLNCGVLVGLLSPPGQEVIKPWIATEWGLFEAPPGRSPDGERK